MRKLVFAFAIAAVGGLTSLAAVGSAAPAVGALALGGAAALVDGDGGLVHKVHGWHCGRKKGHFPGYRKRVFHRHPKACRERYEEDYYDDGYDLSYGDDYYYPRRRYHGGYYPYHGGYYGYGVQPFISFGFGHHGGFGRRHGWGGWHD